LLRLLHVIARGIKVEREYPAIQRLHTGMASFDYQIGGGLPLGYITQLYGPERLGRD